MKVLKYERRRKILRLDSSFTFTDYKLSRVEER